MSPYDFTLILRCLTACTALIFTGLQPPAANASYNQQPEPITPDDTLADRGQSLYNRSQRQGSGYYDRGVQNPRGYRQYNSNQYYQYDNNNPQNPNQVIEPWQRDEYDEDESPEDRALQQEYYHPNT